MRISQPKILTLLFYFIANRHQGLGQVRQFGPLYRPIVPQYRPDVPCYYRPAVQEYIQLFYYRAVSRDRPEVAPYTPSLPPYSTVAVQCCNTVLQYSQRFYYRAVSRGRQAVPPYRPAVPQYRPPVPLYSTVSVQCCNIVLQYSQRIYYQAVSRDTPPVPPYRPPVPLYGGAVAPCRLPLPPSRPALPVYRPLAPPSITQSSRSSKLELFLKAWILQQFLNRATTAAPADPVDTTPSSAPTTESTTESTTQRTTQRATPRATDPPPPVCPDLNGESSCQEQENQIIQQTCFTILTTADLDFNGAETACSDAGHRIATIDSADEIDDVTRVIRKACGEERINVWTANTYNIITRSGLNWFDSTPSSTLDTVKYRLAVNPTAAGFLEQNVEVTVHGVVCEVVTEEIE